MNTKSASEFKKLTLDYKDKLTDGDHIYVKPNIPEKKLNNAINKYAQEVDKNQVIALGDFTVFGSAKEGFLITPAGFYRKGTLESDMKIVFDNLEEVNSFPDDDEILIKTKNGNKKISTIYFNMDILEDFFNEIIKMKEKGLINKTDKMVIVEDMPNIVKINYLKCIILMTYKNDNQIDESELAEIQTLMTQINLDTKNRVEIREYLSEPNISLDNTLKEMGENVPSGSGKALIISLIKDLIRVRRATIDKNIARDFDFIQNIAERYDIRNEQLEEIEEVIKFDEKILAGELDDSQIKKMSKELASKTGAVGIPLAAVYLSGSSIGLAAPGITTGLSALGLGGILGFSSMVTGIGTAVIAGVGVYKGIKYLTSGSEREKTQKRDFMIQEVIKINQKTINNMSEDINYLANELVELVKQNKINKMKINKIANRLTVFKNAIGKLSDKGYNLSGVLEDE